MKKIIQLIFFCSIFVSLTSLAAPTTINNSQILPQTQPDALQQILKRGTLRVGTTGDYPPYTLYSGINKFSGFDIEMAKEFAKYLDVKVEFVKTTGKALGRDLRIGNYDVAMSGLTISPHRASAFLFSDPVVSSGTVPLVRCNDVNNYPYLAAIDRYGVRVVEVKDSPGSEYIKHLKHARIIETDENSTAYAMLIDNSADVMFVDVVEGVYKQQQKKGLCVLNPEEYLTHENKGYLVNKTDTELLAKLNQWIVIMKKSGQLNELAKKWLGI